MDDEGAKVWSVSLERLRKYSLGVDRSRWGLVDVKGELKFGQANDTAGVELLLPLASIEELAMSSSRLACLPPEEVFFVFWIDEEDDDGPGWTVASREDLDAMAEEERQETRLLN